MLKWKLQRGMGEEQKRGEEAGGGGRMRAEPPTEVVEVEALNYTLL